MRSTSEKRQSSSLPYPPNATRATPGGGSGSRARTPSSSAAVSALPIPPPLPSVRPSAGASIRDARRRRNRSRAPPSDCVGSSLTRTDPHDVLHRENRDLAVADLAGPGGLLDRLGGGVGEVVGDQDLQALLGHEGHFVFRSPIDLGLAGLSPEPRDVAHGHSGDPDRLESLADVVQLERLYVGDDEFHVLSFRPSGAFGDGGPYGRGDTGTRDTRIVAIPGRSVLENVEALQFLFLADPQTDGGLEGEEQKARRHGDEHEVDQHEDQLGPELIQATSVEEAGVLTTEEGVVVAGEEGNRQGSPRSDHTVDRDGAYRIVDSEPIEHSHGVHDDDASYGADDRGRPGLDGSNRSSDCDQPRKETVGRERHIRLSVPGPVDQHGTHGTRAGGDQGLESDRHHEFIGRELGTWVESEPADEQDHGAEDHERDRVARNRP